MDYCIRIRKAGYKLKIIRDIFIKHEGEHTQSKCGDVKEAEKITRQMLVDKWGEEEVLDTILLPTTQRDKDFLMKGE